MTTFRTTLLQQGNNVGIAIPEDIVLGFGAGKRVPVTVTLNGYTYGSTVARHGRPLHGRGQRRPIVPLQGWPAGRNTT